MRRDTLLRSLSLVALLVWAMWAFAQGYRPKAGETVLRLDVEGRGSLYIRLNTREAPKTTGEIGKLARGGFYNGLAFHRVERTPRPYLIQFGDAATRLGGTPAVDAQGLRIPFEQTSWPHETGAVGLVRAQNDRDSGGAQFYIMLGPARFLDGNYTVFGQVVSGLELLPKIEKGDRVSAAIVVAG